MIHNVIRSIGGIAAYGVISICLFFAVFSGALLWAALQKKSFLDSMGSLPLREDAAETAKKGEAKHE